MYSEIKVETTTRLALLFGTLVLTLSVVYNPIFTIESRVSNYLAGVYYVETISPEILHTTFQNRKIRVLVIPGHDDYTVGARYRNLLESDITAELGYYLHKYLSEDTGFNSISIRDREGLYEKWFEAYIEKDWLNIKKFRDDLKETMQVAVEKGNVSVPIPDVEHNPAADNTSINLYAINKWANDQNIDIVLHLHFNDYPGRAREYPGKYRGYAVYVPDNQLPNASASLSVAEKIENRLSKHYSQSTFPGEQSTIIKDLELIAVGSNASRNGVSVLLEYGYLYEPQLQDKKIRDATVKELAYQTYLGLVDYFEPDGARAISMSDTTFLPHTFGPILISRDENTEVLALQAALVKDGVYPPSGKNYADCPMSGYYGNCTKAAVKEFQRLYMNDVLIKLGLTNGTGIVGDETLRVLNRRHSRL